MMRTRTPSIRLPIRFYLLVCPSAYPTLSELREFVVPAENAWHEMLQTEICFSAVVILDVQALRVEREGRKTGANEPTLEESMSSFSCLF